MQHAMASASPSVLSHQATANGPGRARPLGPGVASSMQGSIFGPADMLHPQHEQTGPSVMHMSHLQTAASRLVSEPAVPDPLAFKQLMLQVRSF